MVLKVQSVQENENILLNRKEVKINVEAEITPSRSEVIKVVCEKFKCSEDVVKIIKIDSNFGTKVFTIIADIYGSKELKESIALKKKKEIEAGKKVEEEKKKAEEEKKAAEEKPAEEPVETTEEKPAEDNIQKDTEEVIAPKGVSPNDEAGDKESPGQGEEKKE